MPHTYAICWRNGIAWPIYWLFYGLENWRTKVRLPAAGKVLSFFQSFRIASGAHSAHYLMGTDDKVAEACKETTHLSLVSSLRMYESINQDTPTCFRGKYRIWFPFYLSRYRTYLYSCYRFVSTSALSRFESWPDYYYISLTSILMLSSDLLLPFVSSVTT